MAPAIRSISATPARRNGLTLVPMGLRLGFSLLASLHAAHAVPFDRASIGLLKDEDLSKDPQDASLWAYLGTAVALVLLGGAFAGLTIALMGQDEIYLQVIATSGEGSERKNAKKVLDLLKKGKHWVLVTLLLSNVITNETLPIVLDRSLGGGWPAVLSSTVLIVIFGEIVPQSICVRYGLPIGAWMSPLVLGLMWIMSPIAWPTAKLLDKLLGEDHGTTYKKAGLKTLVTLHKTLGTHPDDRLNQDEVTIITAVLDLKDKPVGSIMTPMKDVFTMSTDTVLDENMMGIILSAGYSRIPIHTPDNPLNFVGMLLVKMLITYDPEDALRVRDFSLATLPETRPDTSCLDIVNFFQEGKSHMVLVSGYPGESYGALGVVTLEDVIEELIGEEIIDESDVFIDVHKAIRRMAPAPRTRVPTRVHKGEVVADNINKDVPPTKVDSEAESEHHPTRKADSEPLNPAPQLSTSPKVATTFLMRRRSSGTGSIEPANGPFMLRSDDPDIRQHLKHLGPSNAAQNPKQTRINTVKIKPGGIPSTIPENMALSKDGQIIGTVSAAQGGVGEGLIESAGREASDAVHSIVVGYGTMDPSANPSWISRTDPDDNAKHGDDGHISPKSQPSDQNSPAGQPSHNRSRSTSTIGSLHSVSPSPKVKKRTTARSGSITENTVDINGVKKIILETTSSSDSEGKVFVEQKPEEQHEETETDGKNEHETDKKGKKKRKKRAGKKKKKGESSKEAAEGEDAPLLGRGN